MLLKRVVKATIVGRGPLLSVGTVTLAVDGVAGLAADTLFRNEINTLRRVPGAKLCELTKLAFDVDVPSRQLLACVFRAVFAFGQSRFRCTDLLIEVNPQHRRFYQALLDFEPLGEARMHESVGAPSQLMWVKVSRLKAQIEAGIQGGASRSTSSLFHHKAPATTAHYATAAN